VIPLLHLDDQLVVAAVLVDGHERAGLPFELDGAVEDRDLRRNLHGRER
jgi:hypothetical protein